MHRFFHVLKRDIKFVSNVIKINSELKNFEQNTITIHRKFDEVAKANAQKVAFICVDRKWTFEEMRNFVNRVSSFFYKLGYKKNDKIGIFMESRSEFVGLWLGLSQAGLIPALINSKIKHKVLAHSLHIVNCKALIYGVELAEVIQKAEYYIQADDHNIQMFYYTSQELDSNCDKSSNELLGQHLPSLLENEDSEFKPSFTLQKRYDFKSTDPLLIMYTSGTTGLPKAVPISHRKYKFISEVVKYAVPLRQDDIIYSSLPLYHLLSGVLSTSACILNGCTLVVAKGFYRNLFWKEVKHYECTLADYIGESVKYIAYAKSELATGHKLRAMFGSGIKENIWKELKRKFGIHHIVEFYGSTEGNANMINMDDEVGAVGFLPKFLPKKLVAKHLDLALVKVDPDSGEPLRNSNGNCIKCSVNESGLLIGRINSSRKHDFSGYLDKKETSLKLLHNVFEKDDVFFNTGDMLKRDRWNYFYFEDRLGDTYRWKGENVSTLEVEKALGELLGTDVAVYGVDVPGYDGKAGMAAILLKKQKKVNKQPTIEDTGDTTEVNEQIVRGPIKRIDEQDVLHQEEIFDSGDCDQAEKMLQQYNNHVHELLPSFAIPLFVRFVKKLEMTGTYKYNKVLLKHMAFNPDARQPVYLYLPKQRKFHLLNEQVDKQLKEVKFKL